MKILIILISGLIFACSALELAEFNLKELANKNDYELQYELKEILLQGNQKEITKTKADLFITAYNYKADRDKDGRKYEITVRDSKDPKQNLSLMVFSPNGGETLTKLALINADGSEEVLDDTKALTEYNLFPKSIMTGRKTEKTVSEAKYTLSGKSLPVKVTAETCQIPTVKEKGNLVLKTDSDYAEKKYLSTEKSTPVLVKHEIIADTHRHAYHSANPAITFKRMEKKSRTIRTLSLVGFKSSGNIQPQPNPKPQLIDQEEMK